MACAVRPALIICRRAAWVGTSPRPFTDIRSLFCQQAAGNISLPHVAGANRVVIFSQDRRSYRLAMKTFSPQESPFAFTLGKNVLQVSVHCTRIVGGSV